MNVLIVDDDPNAMQLLASMIVGHGMDATCKFSVNDALAYLETSPVDDFPIAMVLDLLLPERDGIEMLRSLAKNSRRIPTIVVSSGGSDILSIADNFAGAWKWPVIATLAKPVDQAALADALDRARDFSGS